jgi:hypothetical protein
MKCQYVLPIGGGADKAVQEKPNSVTVVAWYMDKTQGYTEQEELEIITGQYDSMLWGKL